MPIDKRLLDILCCPVSKTPVVPLTKDKREQLNRWIEQGETVYVSGEAVTEPLREALITTDEKLIYRVDDDIPVMLEEQAIATQQFDHW
jgi:uncharacterized protein YbaR (Trm112 family)